MKISLDRRLGWVQVRGSRVLEVTHDHQVPTTTENELVPDERIDRGGAKWATAKVGDYAIEMVAVKTDKVIGYSYLSGEPIRLHLYRQEAPAHWFKVADVRYLELGSELFMDEIVSKQRTDLFVSGLIQANFSGADILTFRTRGLDQEAATIAIQSIQRGVGYMPSDWTPEQIASARLPHVIGVADYKSPTSGVAVAHMQPERHAAPHACSMFSTEMLMRMTFPVIDPWAELLKGAA